MFAAHNAIFAGQAKKTASFSGINSSASNTVTIPSHNTGDLIIIIASGVAGTTSVSMGGSYTALDEISIATAYDFVTKVGYAIATSSSMTSGTWTNVDRMTAAVFKNVSAVSPIGGHAIYQDNYNNNLIFPAITVADASGSSQIFQYARDNASTNWTFPDFAAPSGYTKRLGANDQFAMTKDSTITDGYFYISGGGGTASYITGQIEIRSA